ncbi:MAG: copper chaperone PCu(A)C [Oceanococcus sp.]
MAKFCQFAILLLSLGFVACQPQQPTAPVQASKQWASVDDLVIENAWARATPPSAKVAAAYLQIRNTSKYPARLLGGESSRASSIEVHSMSMQDGMMRMRQLEYLEIPSGQNVALAPGGNHFMLFGLDGPLLDGQSLSVTLVFAGEHRKSIVLSVRR